MHQIASSDYQLMCVSHNTVSSPITHVVIYSLVMSSVYVALLVLHCDHFSFIFFFIDTPTTEIYTYCHPLSLHDALPISCRIWSPFRRRAGRAFRPIRPDSITGKTPCARRPTEAARQLSSLSWRIPESCRPSPNGPFRCPRSRRRACRRRPRSEEHTSELQSLMRISYAVFCLKQNT